MVANPKLRVLNLSNCKIPGKTIQPIAEALKQNEMLESLDVSRNYIDTDGAKSLADALTGKEARRILNISNNNIGAAGVKFIMTALKTHTKLYHLNLNTTFCSDNAIPCITPEALKRNTALRILGISNNYSNGDKGAGALVDLINNVLKKNTTLRVLDIQGMAPIEKKVMAALIDLAKTHPTLWNINVDKACVNRQTLQTILEEKHGSYARDFIYNTYTGIRKPSTDALTIIAGYSGITVGALTVKAIAKVGNKLRNNLLLEDKDSNEKEIYGTFTQTWMKRLAQAKENQK